jgi:hypothetical protein
VKSTSSKDQVQTSVSCPKYIASGNISKKTLSAVAAAIEEDSLDSEEDEDQQLPQANPSSLLIIDAKKKLSAVLKPNSERYTESSESDCSSETCESKTTFYVDTADDINPTKYKNSRRRSPHALNRKNVALRNAHWTKKEKKRKSSLFYKIALLDLDDSDMCSLPAGADHQVR